MTPSCDDFAIDKDLCITHRVLLRRTAKTDRPNKRERLDHRLLGEKIQNTGSPDMAAQDGWE
jgi:hypothetical protein